MKNIYFKILFIVYSFVLCNFAYADDGYRLWLKYDLISDNNLLQEYRGMIHAFMINGESATIQTAKDELERGLNGLLGASIPETNNLNEDGIIVVGNIENIQLTETTDLKSKVEKVGNEGFVILNERINGKKVILITANTDIGILYGVFHFLRLLQTHQDISSLDIVSSPKMKLRMLNHWDMLN